MLEKYWMVHCPSSGTPRVRHSAYSLALEEATRLARLNPGNTFFVLEALNSVVLPLPDVEIMNLDELPF